MLAVVCQLATSFTQVYITCSVANRDEPAMNAKQILVYSPKC
jgi:hypothetical protein